MFHIITILGLDQLKYAVQMWKYIDFYLKSHTSIPSGGVMVHALDGTLDTRVPWVSWARNKGGEVVPTMRPPCTDALNAYLKEQGVTGNRFKLLGGAHAMIEHFLSLPGIITGSSHSHDYSVSDSVIALQCKQFCFGVWCRIWMCCTCHVLLVLLQWWLLRHGC